MHSAAAALQDAAARHATGACGRRWSGRVRALDDRGTSARYCRVREHQPIELRRTFNARAPASDALWLASLDGSIPCTYLRFVHMFERAGHVRVSGAGPRLAYEVVGPTTDQSSASEVNSSHRGVWRLVAQQLPEYRCVLLDFREHGESEHVSPPAYNPEHHAADLAEVIPKLVRSPYAILAHSAGALAAMRFMTSAPPPTPAAMPVRFVWVDLDPLVPRWQVDYFHQGVASVARTFLAVDDALRGFRRIYPNIPKDRLRAFVTEGLRQVDGGWRMKLDPGTYATWEPGDLRPCLPRVTCPTLVLRGADSIVTSAEGVTELSTGLPKSEVREIKGGSHMLLPERPDEVPQAIPQFLLL